MQAKLTIEDDLPLIIIGIIGSILLILLFVKGLSIGAKKSERKRIKTVNIPFIVMYALPLLIIGVLKEVFNYDMPNITKRICTIISIIVVIIPTIYNIVKLGLSGILISFFQAICGLMLGAVAYASIVTAVIILVVGFIGSFIGNEHGTIQIRSVDDGTVVYISYWGGDCWKDQDLNCYYRSSIDRWYDDYGNDYIYIRDI